MSIFSGLLNDRPLLMQGTTVMGFFLASVAAADDFRNIGAHAITPSFDISRFGSLNDNLHDWHVVVGAGASFHPKYEGSDEYKVSPVPFVSAVFLDTVAIDPRGVGVRVLESGPMRFDLSLGYDLGRKEDDADALRGMGDVDFGITAGGRATYDFGNTSLFMSMDKTIGGSDGLLVTAGAAISQPLSDKLVIGAAASATFADNNYMDSYFGVDAKQSTRSGYARYNPGAGIKSVDLSASATYLITKNWLVKGVQTVGFLAGEAADSPIVEKKVQSTTMLMVGYRF